VQETRLLSDASFHHTTDDYPFPVIAHCSTLRIVNTSSCYSSMVR
jgi:hypothetical protein